MHRFRCSDNKPWVKHAFRINFYFPRILETGLWEIVWKIIGFLLWQSKLLSLCSCFERALKNKYFILGLWCRRLHILRCPSSQNHITFIRISLIFGCKKYLFVINICFSLTYNLPVVWGFWVQTPAK